MKITVFLTDIGYLIKLLNNPWVIKNLKNISNFEDWHLTLVACKKTKCIVSVSDQNLVENEEEEDF